MSAVCLYLGILSVALAYDNVALHKPAYQEHPYGVSGLLVKELIQASNAVDGQKSNRSIWGGQCVISANGQTNSTWWVNLTNILSIHHITIYYRTGNVDWGPSNGFAARFIGFSVYVSNTTDKSDGVLCFKDNTFTLNTIPDVFNTMCLVQGQYVIYYNEYKAGDRFRNFSGNRHAYNDVCEIEVYGCPISGFYGPSCSRPCPDPNCRYCHIEMGACQGCKAGYRGHRCELECPYGFFGEGCANSCNSKCSGCNNINGSCVRGCRPGWKGHHCQEKCDNKYGPACAEICGYCLDSKPCNHINGSCVNGCAPGFHGDACKKECDNSYGLKCAKTCGHCLDSKPCHNLNGTCVNGCAAGFYGEKCDQICSTGYFGMGCVQECSTFCKISKDCHHITGQCKGGCKNGWQGMDCFEVSKSVDSEKQSFYSVLGVLCGSLLLNGIFIAYIIISRKSRNRRTKQYQTNRAATNTITGQQENAGHTINDEYQELGDMGKGVSTYDEI